MANQPLLRPKNLAFIGKFEASRQLTTGGGGERSHNHNLDEGGEGRGGYYAGAW